MRLLKLIALSVGTIIFGVVFALILLAGSNGFNFASIRAYVILSGSMEPKIPLGSIIVVKPKPFYFTGDIISFNPDSGSKTAVTHRISKKYETGIYNSWSYETKGDTNNAVDLATVKQEHIIGKVFLTIPYLGYAAQAVKTQKGFIFLIIVPATILIYEELKKIKEEISSFYRKLRLKRELQQLQAGIVTPKTSKRISLNRYYLIIIPFFASFFVLTSFSLSYFSDREQANSNNFQAGIWGISITPTPIPTSTPMLTPIPTSIPTATPIPTVTPTPMSQCMHENAECEVNNSDKTCCAGLVCLLFNPNSGNYKCQLEITPIPSPTP